MKKAIGQIGDVVTYAEVNSIELMPQWRHVKITSRWLNARDSSEHVKFDMCMDSEMFAQFKKVLNEM